MFKFVELDRTGRQDQILRTNGINNIGRGQAFCRQRRNIKIHRHHPEFAAVRVRHSNTRKSDELGAHLIDGDISELLFR